MGTIVMKMEGDLNAAPGWKGVLFNVGGVPEITVHDPNGPVGTIVVDEARDLEDFFLLGDGQDWSMWPEGEVRPRVLLSEEPGELVAVSDGLMCVIYNSCSLDHLRDRFYGERWQCPK